MHETEHMSKLFYCSENKSISFSKPDKRIKARVKQ